MKKNLLFGCMIISMLGQGIAFGQQLSSAPVMTMPVSPEANGMGGLSASVISDNALAPIANPAQLGIFSLHSILNASSFLNARPLKLDGTTFDQTMYAYSANAGYNLSRVTPLPFGLSLGIGFSHLSLDAQTDWTPPFSYWEHQYNVTLGLGFDWLVRVGLGYTIQSFSTTVRNLASIQSENGESNSASYGAILEVSVVDLVSALHREPLTIREDLRPLLNLTLAWTERNVGNDSSVVSPFIVAPIPRQAVLGMNVMVGVETEVAGKPWRVFSFTFAREASDALLASSIYYLPANGLPFCRYYYRGGLGDISPIDNLILGRSNGNVDMRRGWQLQLAQLIYLRGGSVAMQNGLNYSTTGLGFRLDGLMKLLAAYNLVDIRNAGAWKFISDHLDLQYDYSTYSGETSLTGSDFQSLNLVVK